MSSTYSLLPLSLLHKRQILCLRCSSHSAMLFSMCANRIRKRSKPEKPFFSGFGNGYSDSHLSCAQYPMYSVAISIAAFWVSDASGISFGGAKAPTKLYCTHIASRFATLHVSHPRFLPLLLRCLFRRMVRSFMFFVPKLILLDHLTILLSGQLQFS